MSNTTYRDQIIEMLNRAKDDPNDKVYQMMYTILILNKQESVRVAESKLFTIQEVCEILGISRRTVYRYIQDGRINAIKAGRDYRFTPEEIERFKGGI